ncbi:MAG: sugar ABC transporter permease [Candidatus Limiplasma sp.]|nr:sugar ABC transporter permease [Candidatus Limiplasma sp.]
MTTLNSVRLERHRRLSRYAVREHGTNLLFLLPAFLLFAYVVLIPFFQSIPISFTDKKAIFARSWEFIGLENYWKLLKSGSFQDSFLHTVQFSAVYIVGANLLGLVVALMLWHAGRFNNFMRTLMFMPFTVSLVASTKVWSYVYTDIFTPLTGQPSPLGISSQVIYGLATIAIWRDMGYCMLIYIAALQTVPHEYYEAARVEGANGWHEFLHITAPMIVPAFTANITLLLSWGLRCFDYSQMVINMKTAKTTAVFVYEYIFGNARAGLGQAGAIILTLVLVVLTNIVTTILRKREVEM